MNSVNPVEIEEAISHLAREPFDPDAFPFQFLEAFGNKPATIKRLRAGNTNVSDVPNGVLHRNNIHLATSEPGRVDETLKALLESTQSTRAKAKFILATDGITLEAQDLASGESIATAYESFADHFGFFLPLAGISTIQEIKNNPVDVKATGRLNRLYVELLKENPDWATAERQHDMNHFMARLIFCFFAEDTDIFHGNNRFTATVDQMSAKDSSNTHRIIGEIFRAMNTRLADRVAAKLPVWADAFPYVNGELFSGSTDVPRFSRMARAHLRDAGTLNWQEINPDIFGSMIQAITEDEERGTLGMHYTSVPNILKVLNPLFLDDLRAQLEAAGDNTRILLNLRNRMARIRVFDPACGSGNFLVIAYKEMRAIEAEINRRRGETDRKSAIPRTNFRGIELRDFPAEIARLALIIAEYQCDVRYRGQKEALLEFLPLDSQNWITCGNALRLDWLSICPPTGTGVKVVADDLFQTPLDQAEMDFENEGGETYICGNPPYIGRRNQSKEQKQEIKDALSSKIKSSASLDYVFGWIEKASNYILNCEGEFAYVMTNSVVQGVQVPIYWPYLISKGLAVNFAHRSFPWSNNAKDNAGVTCVILGIGKEKNRKFIYENEQRYEVKKINPYLQSSDVQVVTTASQPLSEVGRMNYGNLPGDGNYLTLNASERKALLNDAPHLQKLIIPLYGAQEFIRGLQRYCLWIDDDDLDVALRNAFIQARINKVRELRKSSKDPSYNVLEGRPHQFRDRNLAKILTIIAPTICSETREYLPAAVFPGRTGTTNQAYALYDAPLWNMALIASRLHLVWIATVCGKLKTDFRYSNTLGWNTFPVPDLTEENKANLTRCAENILLAREAHFPATIADLYDPEKMPENLRAAHDANDEILERIYIGRRFRNDTERLEKLFARYTQMTAKEPATKKKGKKAK